MSEKFEDGPPPLIVVVDTSVLIRFKSLVAVTDQWGLLVHMSELLATGVLTFPKQVPKELTTAQHPDAPGAWAGGNKHLVTHSQPSDESVGQVLAVAPLLVDVEADDDNEAADPYIAAMACELAEKYGCRVVVATNDYVDRPPTKTSLVSACDALNVDCCTPESFIAWVQEGTEPPDIDVWD